ncbi:MAG: hypothetical protein WA655_01605 [Candidatus Korobacteraceae bacterium]
MVTGSQLQIWIEGVGGVPVSAGWFVRTPADVPHQAYEEEEALIAHDTWFPGDTLVDD